MGLTDPIAEMMTLMRNALGARKDTVEVKKSKLNESILKILKEENFIANYKALEDKKQGILKVYLKYASDKSPVITGLKRVSRPGLREYVGKDELPPVLGGLGIAIISTSKGLMTDKKARQENVGGEVICKVW